MKIKGTDAKEEKEWAGKEYMQEEIEAEKDVRKRAEDNILRKEEMIAFVEAKMIAFEEEV